jgi:acetylornithine deacetylase/succinyl-diaminopimelate desuccinylase-like protein
VKSPAGRRRPSLARERKTLAAAALLIALLLATLQCRRAGGAAEDPIDREAEEALVSYLKIDTTNPPGNETQGAVFLRDLLAKDGITAQLVGSDPARQGIYARLESGSSENALLLLSHIDVVPADASAWRNPPFAGKREGGYIWGRGALDDKSLTIAHLMAFVDLKRRGARLTRDVVFLAVPDEELGGLQGTKRLLDEKPELFENVGFVMNEAGSNETALDKVLFWGIEVHQKVPLWLRVTTDGKGGHAASPATSGGASAKLVRALARIDQIETPYRLTESVASAAALSSSARKDGRGQALKVLRHPLDLTAVERDLPPSYRTMLRDTITITTLSAGSSVNVVPSSAMAELDIRLVPGSTTDAMLAQVRDAVGELGTVEVIVAGEPVPDSPAGGPLYETIARAMLASAPGSAVGPIGTAGATDSRFFRQRGIVAYGVSPFKVNYYDAAGAHGEDERIRSRFFAEGVKLMRTIVRDFCAAK